MAHRVELTPSAAKALARLPRSIAARIATALDALGDNPRPHGCVAIKGVRGAYRIRIGDYRAVYSVHDDVLRVLVIRIGHRREVYRDF